MKSYAFLIILSFMFYSCSGNHFSRYAQYNTKAYCYEDQQYLCISNDSLKLKYVSFGGFKFASSEEEFKKLNKKRPKFKNILLYGDDRYINTEYYVLIDNKKRKKGFVYSDSIIGKNHLTIAVSDSCHESNKKFLLKGLRNL
ncbi:hypothetical protein [Chryseobacterium foetidum]|uniref:hypothetical protein n=1 Tax=Chryseobacterium foetidum TaxID=2951057 RepID=UPI0021C8EC80|nr:hypothetical protein [Chryseobacterium foetidum]